MKEIYADFSNGLVGEQDRNLPDGFYSAGRGIELYNKKGYIMPGNSMSDITISGLAADIVDIVTDEVNDYAFLLSNGAKIHRLTDVSSTPTIDSNLDGSSHNYYSVTGMSGSMKGTIIRETTSSNLFWAYNNSTAGYLGRSRLTGTFAGGVGDSITYKTLSSVAHSQVPKDITEWNANFYITSGRYIDQFAPATSTISNAFFDLGSQWQASCLVKTQYYLGIFSSSYVTTGGIGKESQFTLIDGSSATIAVRNVPLKGVKKIYACINHNGTVHFWANIAKTAHVHCILTDEGYEIVNDLMHDISGTLTNLTIGGVTGGNNSTVDIFDNRILYGTATYPFVFSYGKKPVGSGEILSMPFYYSTTSGARINCLKSTSANRILFGVFDGTNYKASYLTFQDSNYNTPLFKLPYKDLGQRVILNYIEIYSRALASGDSITVGVDTNYGTSNTIKEAGGVLSFAKHGAITYKKFDLDSLECDAFRPTLTWTAGSAKIYKIVIDYSFIDN